MNTRSLSTLALALALGLPAAVRVGRHHADLRTDIGLRQHVGERAARILDEDVDHQDRAGHHQHENFGGGCRQIRNQEIHLGTFQCPRADVRACFARRGAGVR